MTEQQHNSLVESISSWVFNTRWLLLVFNFGLIAALGIYSVRFLFETGVFLYHAPFEDLESLKVGVLGLVDAYMIANLLVMIIKGSYQIFISKFKTSADSRPQWLDHVDTGLLKVKLCQSIAAISSIQLLKDFTNLEKTDWVLVWHRMIIHAIFLAGAWVMARIWKDTTESHRAAEEKHSVTVEETHSVHV